MTAAAADSLAHDDDRKYMASPATACNEGDDLVNRGNDKGNGDSVDNDEDVLVGAQRKR